MRATVGLQLATGCDGRIATDGVQRAATDGSQRQVQRVASWVASCATGGFCGGHFFWDVQLETGCDGWRATGSVNGGVTASISYDKRLFFFG